jgi:hypothetical protein
VIRKAIARADFLPGDMVRIQRDNWLSEWKARPYLRTDHYRRVKVWMSPYSVGEGERGTFIDDRAVISAETGEIYPDVESYNETEGE